MIAKNSFYSRFSRYLWKSQFKNIFRKKMNSENKKEKELKAYALKLQYTIARENLCNELLKEAGIEFPTSCLHITKKLYLCTTKIDALKKMGILSSETNVLENFINQIEGFPFSAEEVLSNIPPSQEVLTIAQNRSVVEKKYLAWKLNVAEKNVQKVFTYFKTCCFPGRSLRSIQKNLTLLKQIKNINEWDVANKILFLNLIPCDEYTVRIFNEFPEIMKWNNLSSGTSEIIKWPHRLVTLLVNELKEKGFNEEQIQHSINFRTYSFFEFLDKLDVILNNKHLLKFRADKEFLCLLKIPLQTLKGSEKIGILYRQHLDEPSSESDSSDESDDKKKVTSEMAIRNLVGGALNLTSNDIEILTNHPNWLKSTKSEVHETFHYLYTNFSKTEIIESLPIILYPRSMIEKAMEEVMLKKPELISAGFKEGYISGSNLFTRGSKIKDKRLSLCLYFLEKNIVSENK